MSVEAITWALKQPIRKSSVKFVLVVLANCASGDTFRAYPSVPYLAAATGQDRKTVLAALAQLLEWGFVADTGKRAGTTRQVVVYQLHVGPDLFAEQSQKRNSTENGTVPKNPGKSPVFPREQSQKRDTETSLTVTDTKEQGSPALAAMFPGVSAQVLADFKTLRIKHKAPLTETAAAGIRREAEKAGMTLEAVLTLCCERGWRAFNHEWNITATGAPNGTGRRGESLTATSQRVNAEHDRRERGH